MKSKTMKRQVIDKLNNRAGESITETLVALLISALALAMLAGVIAAASRILTNSRTKLNNYYDKCNDMVEMSNGTDTAVITVEIPATGDKPATTVTENVSYCKNDVFSGMNVVSYRIITP